MNTTPAGWHVITPEYPPTIGGVGDYSRAVAAELRTQGETVTVWHPGAGPLPEGYSRSGLQALSTALDATPTPRRLFVQWVPHGYGYLAMNVGFSWWLLERARRGDHIDLMLHEPFLMFREGTWKQDAVAAVHRLMMTLALRSASRLWVAIPSWESRVRPWLFGREVPCQWLPVPSNVAVSAERPIDLAERFGNSHPVVGHFGTYGKHIAAQLKLIIPAILGQTQANVLLLGRDSDQMAEEFQSPRVKGNGTEAANELSRSIAACTLFVQPFTDGVSSRRGSAMAVLAHGKPLITTSGPPTESIWAESQAVRMVSNKEIPVLAPAVEQLLADPIAQAAYGAKARQLYEQTFALPRNMRRLRESPMVRR